MAVCTGRVQALPVDKSSPAHLPPCHQHTHMLTHICTAASLQLVEPDWQSQRCDHLNYLVVLKPEPIV